MSFSVFPMTADLHLSAFPVNRHNHTFGLAGAFLGRIAVSGARVLGSGSERVVVVAPASQQA